MTPHQKYFFDPNFEKHQKDIKRGKLNYWDRYITLFSYGDYGVKFDYPEIGYMYKENGELYEITVFIFNKKYPKKSYTYDINGNLKTVNLRLNGDEQYGFEPNGKLNVHWIGKNGYDENGELFGTRASYWE